MASKITQEQIIELNELYLKIGTYTGVSRAMGGSPSPTTVKKYIIPNYQPAQNKPKKTFSRDELPPFEDVLKMFRGLENYGDLCVLSQKEEIEIEELWEEMTL